MNAGNGSRFPWRMFFSELVGTALLLLVGLSMVIVMFGTGSPMARLIPSEGLRRLIFWIGPMIGAFLASLACSFLAKRITVAKLYHFDSDRDGLFRRMSHAERTKWRIGIRHFGGMASLLRTSGVRGYSHNLMSYNRLCRFKASHHHLAPGLLSSMSWSR
jgi:hypothetical protein